MSSLTIAPMDINDLVIAPAKKKKKILREFTPEEDEVIKREIRKGTSYAAIAAQLHNRCRQAVWVRWENILSRTENFVSLRRRKNRVLKKELPKVKGTSQSKSQGINNGSGDNKKSSTKTIEANISFTNINQPYNYTSDIEPNLMKRNNVEQYITFDQSLSGNQVFQGSSVERELKRLRKGFNTSTLCDCSNCT